MFYDYEPTSRLMLGSARYPSPAVLAAAVEASGAEVITVSLRRAGAGESSGGNHFWRLVESLNKRVLPNTAGCHTVKEAVSTAHLARDVFKTHWIKLEIVGEDAVLYPDGAATLEAARILSEEGFAVFPYVSEDLHLCARLLHVGCRVLMPWGAPIGSALGLANPHGLKAVRRHFPDTTLVVDAGLGLPSHAAAAMEMGFDAVLCNSAVACAGDPARMAAGFAQAVCASRAAFLADAMEPCVLATPSSPAWGLAFSP